MAPRTSRSTRSTPIAAVRLIVHARGRVRPGTSRDVEGVDSVPVELIESMADAGMEGLEVDHPDHRPDQRRSIGALSERLELVAHGCERLPRCEV